MKRTVFPFTAVMGQERIKKALIWNLVNPLVGGVLICGEKGTAKSTLVRGAALLAPGMRVIELPLNTTEDRLLGSIDFEYAVRYGEKHFESGILKNAHGNLLYVDEVNLLSDHIVKSLLEAASSGMNIVEREGISFQHEARFVLVGSMNPEEGTLRPQFLDRFGLYVEVTAEQDINSRMEIVRRRVAFEKNPVAYTQSWHDQTIELANQVIQARALLPRVAVTPGCLDLAASIAKEAYCEGHRADMIMVETARSIAALNSKTEVSPEDINEAAEYALPHRMRQLPPRMSPRPEQHQPDRQEFKNQENASQSQPDPMDDSPDNPLKHDLPDELPPPSSEQNQPYNEQPNTEKGQLRQDSREGSAGASEQLDAPDQPFAVTRWLGDCDFHLVRKGSGRRSLVKTTSRQGRYVKYRFPGQSGYSDIALDATLRAAAPYQRMRNRMGMAVAIKRSDIRVKLREKRTGNTILFVVDASGSMGANKRMQAVKGAIISLLNDAYQKRDRVGLITFKNQSAQLLLGITRSVELAQRQLGGLTTGGQTPLSEGLEMARVIVKTARMKDNDVLPVIVLVSDGKATWCKSGLDPFAEAIASAKKISADGIKTIVVNTEQGFIRLNLAHRLAEAMNAEHLTIDDLKAESLSAAVSLVI